MRSHGVVWVDHDPNQHRYRSLKLPANWEMYLADKWGSIGASHAWIFDRYPNASHYGWLADDTFPRTRHWDRKLEEAADNGNISYARDLWLSEDDGERDSLIRGTNLSSGVCYGGDLVRAVGWLALPGLFQAGIDTTWVAICGKLRRMRYVEDVTVEHKHFRTGKRKDEGWSNLNLPHIDRDLILRDEWVASREYIETLERICHLCPQRTDWTYATMTVEPELNERDIRWQKKAKPWEQPPPPPAWEQLPVSRRLRILAERL